MNNFNKVHNRLTEKNFKTLENEAIEKLGFALYENEKIRVLLKQLHTDLELENIQLYSNQIRIFLLEHSKNIYNTYLILCTDEDIDYEKFFMIERNNIGLRKYVVRDENDLNRIPFLDNTVDESENNSKNLNDMEYNPELKSIFSLLEQYDSKNIKLKDYQVEEIVNTLMQGMEIDYEY
ncbi:ABC-three component system middle component 1 [Ureibacillus thermosphaericus]|uniref:ABC-three component system middle component 1 n=1 Tax=Ureibacillus thermosphaericus TaxID=51173 RepID=UPI0002E8372E|nr:ABC-three component system middle component 1 [Ureibacillus thermosphaericus]